MDSDRDIYKRKFVRFSPAVCIGIIQLALFGLFCGYCIPWISKNISVAIPTIMCYLTILNTISLFKISFTDPGMLPLGTHFDYSLFPSLDDAGSPCYIIGSPCKQFSSKTSQDLVLAIKFCTTCQIWRTARASHCKKCNRCIDRLDHHCIWLNCCIGRCNYRYFMTYISTAAVLGALVSVFSLLKVFSDPSHNFCCVSFHAISQSKIAFAVGVIASVISLFPFSLCIFHFMLMMNGETTREYVSASRLLPD
ncbi:DHHC palmitoyltransferase-domain-containing protein [Lipomyces oligophaga]|uniref:DHHC palmitoyltransferase-domain-containing protein n=1 Tax=Lipomyces oligophaga TaxID=45792 RepID=UPI0034CEE036